MTTIAIDPKYRDLLKIESVTHNVTLKDFTNKMVEKVLGDETLKSEIITEIKLGLGKSEIGNTADLPDYDSLDQVEV